MIPGIWDRSPRTEAAQPPQVMFGTLSTTSVVPANCSGDNWESDPVEELDAVAEGAMFESFETPHPNEATASPMASAKRILMNLSSLKFLIRRYQLLQSLNHLP